jgi:hypothetical protein
MTTSQSLSSGPERRYFFFQTRERLYDRLYIIFVQFFEPREIDRRTLLLPTPLFLLYYFLRPLRVLIKSTRLLFATPSKRSNIFDPPTLS